MRDTQQETKFHRLTEEPVEKLVLQLSVPTVASMLITSFYNMADTFFAGRIGNSATGAIGVAFSLMAIIQACGFFFGHGSGNYISRMLGQQNTAEAEKMAATGFFSSFLFGVVIAVTGLVFLEPLAGLLGSTPTIMPYTVEYLRYILIGAPFMTASLTLNNQLRFQGSANFAMIGITAGGLVNLALDPLFMFACGMGVSGAALAMHHLPADRFYHAEQYDDAEFAAFTARNAARHGKAGAVFCSRRAPFAAFLRYRRLRGGANGCGSFDLCRFRAATARRAAGAENAHEKHAVK